MYIPNSTTVDISTDLLTLKNLPRFLHQFAVSGHFIACDFQDDYMGWKQFYSAIIAQSHLADFGAALTAMLECFLKYDTKQGVITSEDADTVFLHWQELIVRAMARCEDRPLLVHAPEFMPASQEQLTVYNFLTAYVDETISAEEWPAVRDVLKHLLYKIGPCLIQEPRELELDALNAQLEEQGVPYQISWKENGTYSVFAKEDRYDRKH